jgi:hypothetical protein
VYAPAGSGKSTLLRHLAYHTSVDDACGGVAHLSARDHSRDDMLQALFEVFYSSDIPVKPTRGELRHRLQHVRAALLLDDVDMPDEEVQELADFAPECGFVLVGERAHPSTGARSVQLGGLPADAASALFVHALGRTPQPEDLPAVEALCGLAHGVPGRLLQLGVSAGQSAGSLREFMAATLAAGPPPLGVHSTEDMRVLGLLAAVPGLQLDAEQLATISGLRDVPERLDRWIACGLVTASPPPAGAANARTTLGLAAGVVLDATAWGLDDRRAEVHAHFAGWARQPVAVLAPGEPTETVRILHSDAKRRGEWRSVLALGALLEAAYALGGRWDAWREVAATALDAARELGDIPASWATSLPKPWRCTSWAPARSVWATP